MPVGHHHRAGVSIHAPARGATDHEEHGKGMKPSFNPRSRTGSDASGIAMLVGQLVSIHAPARGATYRDGPGKDAILVSIHAPARGATSAC